MSSPVTRFYSSLVFTKPYLVIAILLLLVGFFGWQTQNFRLDASADSLLLEDDPDLEFSREINVRYGIREAVTIAYTPTGDLFSREELNKLGELRDELLAINRVESVDSILNVPIFEDTPLTGISEDYLTLSDQDIDLVSHVKKLLTAQFSEMRSSALTEKRRVCWLALQSMRQRVI